MSKKKHKVQNRIVPQLKDTKKQRVSRRFLVGIAVGLCVAIALYLRVYLPYDDIFTNGWVKFSSNDAYYYMRLVDNMVHNFPHLMSFDQYLVYPDGQPIQSFYLFARLLAGVSWIIGLGHPAQHLIDTVCAFVPAVMGALVVIPVYFIGKALWGRLAGVISAALIAVLPGEFLGRSMLGFADHHVAEVLFSTVAMMFLIMAVRNGQKCMKLNNLKSRDSVKVVIYSILAGIFWGIYGLTWQSGLLFLFITFLYFVVQFVIDHLRHRDIRYLCIIGVVFNLVAMMVFLPSVIHLSAYLFYLTLMSGTLLLPLVLGGLSWFINRKALLTYWYPLSVLGLGLVGAGIFYLVNPSLFMEIVGVFRFVFVPSGTQLTTIEMQPLLFPNGSFTLSLVWGNFGLTIFVALASLVILARGMVKRGDANKSLIVVWTVIILAMALGQRRFTYYLAVNVALLTGYMSWLMFKFCGVGETSKRKMSSLYTNDANVVFVALIILIVVFLPIIPSAVSTASQVRYAPSDAWCESLDWLRENSPEPFGDSDAYWRLSNGKENSDSTYGVLSWWDYGYWITRIGHRIPNVTPGQNAMVQADVATFFTSQDKQTGDGIINELGSKYVIIDLDTVTSKFWAVARYAGKDQSDYFGIYYVADGNQLRPVQAFYPTYYRSLAVRLYNFDGKATIEQKAIALCYEDRTDMAGNYFRLITDSREFGTYNDAEAYVSNQKVGNWVVVSGNPFISPVALDAVEHYRLVYGSEEKLLLWEAEISEVKIFEYAE